MDEQQQHTTPPPPCNNGSPAIFANSCRLLKMMRELAILDMGCGTGRETQALQNHYPMRQLTGLDLSDGMLAYARKRYLLGGGRWLAGDIENLPLRNEMFDLVFSSLAIQWCESLTNVLDEVYQVLKPGGWFVFSTPGGMWITEK